MVRFLCAAGGRKVWRQGSMYTLLVAGGIQVMPVRSMGQCVQLGVGVEGDCARLGRGVAVLDGPALSMIANVRCCRAIVRVMSM